MSQEDTQKLVKDIVVPIIVSVFVGVSSSYVATQTAIATIETKMSYTEAQIIDIKKVITVVNNNQIELAKSGARMDSAELRIKTVDARVDRLEAKHQQ